MRTQIAGGGLMLTNSIAKISRSVLNERILGLKLLTNLLQIERYQI